MAKATPDTPKKSVYQIVTDQVITAQLLKHANSALYSRGHVIESVPMAVQHLGAQTVTNLVLTLSLQSLVTGRDIFLEDRKLIWKHSLSCALLSRAIAPIARVERELVFLCGLMIDFGKSILLSLIHDLMNKQKEYQATPKTVIDYLVETYHPKVGGVVGEKWKMPAGGWMCWPPNVRSWKKKLQVVPTTASG